MLEKIKAVEYQPFLTQKKLIVSHAPFLHSGRRITERSYHTMLAALPALVLGFYHYGMPAAPRQPFWPTVEKSILEVPMTVCHVLGRSLPASGGGYFRLLPYGLGRWLLARGSAQAGCPAVFYMHPWEMDPDQPFVANAPWLSRFRHYTGQRALAGKLRRLHKDFRWGRMDETIVQPILKAEGRQA